MIAYAATIIDALRAVTLYVPVFKREVSRHDFNKSSGEL